MTSSRNYAITKDDASARLRYVSQVRSRTQRAAPAIHAWVLISLGALLIARGLLIRYDHLQLPSTALLVALLAAGALARRYISHRRQLRRGVVRHEHASTVAAILVGLLVWLLVPIVDDYPLAVAAAMATSAWITGQLRIAAATAILGILTGALLAHGTPMWTALVVFGAGLTAVGAVRALMPGDNR